MDVLEEWESDFMRKFFVRLGIFIIGIMLFGEHIPSVYAAKSQVVIINQVRGQSCCDVGSVEAVQFQLQALQRLQLPATFVLRFDALKNPVFPALLNAYPKIEKGLFLEVTPDLAFTAQVQYAGSKDDWYAAKHAYLLGYSIEDRKRLIDTAMTAFHSAFHTYPKTTAAWMIDAWSLQYLVDRYHITAHEITRDQWGTDSYTLYGGPIGMIYQPSKRWPLIPAQGDNALPLKILRQTLPDPLWNYGDTQSATTSQPNDYVLAGKNIDYFISLLEQTLLEQQTPQTVVLGLENSMRMETQEEYLRQLEFLSILYKKHSDLFTVKTISDVSKQATPSIVIQHGKDIFNSSIQTIPESWWISTSHYRARLLHTTTQLALTDMRVYNPSLADPYILAPTESKHAYWIVPFALDGSRLRLHEEKIQRFFPWYRHLFSFIWRLPRANSEPSDVFSDIRSTPIALQFPVPVSKIILRKSENEYEMQYTSKDGDEILKINTKDLKHIGSSAPSWNVSQENIPKNTGAFIQIDKQDRETTLTPLLAETTHQTWLMPEKNTSPIHAKNSSFYVNNIMARFGRNPVRTVLILRDSDHLPTQPLELPKLICKGNACGSIVIQQDSSKGWFFIDLYPVQPGFMYLSVRIDNTEYPVGYAWSAENCREQKKRCILNPFAFLGYVATSIFDRLQLHE